MREINKRQYQKNEEYRKRYRIENREKMLERSKQWDKNNRERIQERRNLRHKTDLKFNLNDRISAGIRQSLKRNKNGRHWETLLDYTVEDLIKRLKKTMPEGYTWEDFLTGELHIDHIIPIDAFNFTRPEHTDFRRCWALSNLRLLPAKENLKKWNKLDKPFQPALKI